MKTCFAPASPDTTLLRLPVFSKVLRGLNRSTREVPVSLLTVLLAITSISFDPRDGHAMDACRPLPQQIKVLARSPQCGGAPAVILRGRWQRSFSAAFRWDDGSSDGQDRSPFALNDSSASSSPYKTQRRTSRGRRGDTLCYGKFINRNGYPVPEQLTIKVSTAPQLSRFCVDF